MQEKLKKEFEVWIRSVCFQEPTNDRVDLARDAYLAGAQSVLDRPGMTIRRKDERICELELLLSRITRHPLSVFFEEVQKEYAASLQVYPEWSTKEEAWQIGAVKGECLEWEAGALKSQTTGKHERELGELPQLANVAGKRWLEIRKEEL